MASIIKSHSNVAIIAALILMIHVACDKTAPSQNNSDDSAKKDVFRESTWDTLKKRRPELAAIFELTGEPSQECVNFVNHAFELYKKFVPEEKFLDVMTKVLSQATEGAKPDMNMSYIATALSIDIQFRRAFPQLPERDLMEFEKVMQTAPPPDSRGLFFLTQWPLSGNKVNQKGQEMITKLYPKRNPNSMLNAVLTMQTPVAIWDYNIKLTGWAFGVEDYAIMANMSMKHAQMAYDFVEKQKK
jgi:hypothetical protein